MAGFQPFYGTVYSQEDLNRALASEQPLELVPSTDTSGHGTFLAGVAAGRQIQSPTTFSGAAPDAALAVVRLSRPSNICGSFLPFRQMQTLIRK